MKQRVLIFPAGSEIGLEIYNSLKYSHHVEVFGASCKSDHAAYVYPRENYIEDSRLNVQESDFLERFDKLLSDLDIGFIYPTHDTVACFLAENLRSSARLINPDPETNRIARCKQRTYETFREYDFCPTVYQETRAVLPVFLKPRQGQGGKGSARAVTSAELEFYLGQDPELLVTEYLPGEELSVDCFSDFHGQLRFIGPRSRERVLMGISFRSSSVELTEEIAKIAHAINDLLKLDGAWFFQVKKDSTGRYKLLEFAPRQASTMGLYRHSGVNFALLSLFNALKMPVEITSNDYAVQLDRCLQNRYRANFSFRRVYVDFDETLVVGHHVHEMAMAFLYQCRNRRIEIVLLTKHRFDLSATLRSCGISESLFTQILHLREEEDKSLFIEPEGAIFIDNYWYDRRAVRKRWGIPVFDADAIECLLW